MESNASTSYTPPKLNPVQTPHSAASVRRLLGLACSGGRPLLRKWAVDTLFKVAQHACNRPTLIMYGLIEFISLATFQVNWSEVRGSGDVVDGKAMWW